MLGAFTDRKAQERYFAVYAEVLRKWPVPAEELDIPTKFGPTRVRRSGPEHGSPIVLLHGVMGSSLSWYPHLAELAAHHPVYAVDSIGEPGHSVETASASTDDDLAEWLSEVLAALGQEKAYLAGVSRGGYLALNLATRSADRIAGVIGLEPAGFAEINVPKFLLWSLREICLWLLPSAIQRRIVAGDPAVRRTLRPLLFASMKYQARLPPQHVFTDDDLRAIEVPVCLVLGERSHIHRAREVAARVAKLNPRISTEIVPKTSHALTLQQPDLITTLVLDFVEADPA
ncbi:alpha/beta fold hydrolase [Amycolatopsis rubida]|uniref:Alpha/beta fold hydrolase n=1 Tax=Amycolatopsis rubida TaxID=112413 RepID=A0A1I5YWI5_9PSEU|nr:MULTISPECIES: alpha/beta fold hydrolase [Amycolatopsis]MYW96336.1 alpha/beta fold hydrolase [Amycolatopsis rubida]NEC61326.1 alpha/beta fold hydrolase [Amycolatopsis rubida]OAP24136.1 Carboxylesterase YbfK [Amycolatopsis sp. M39]SFQ48490.1 Pimeloyl-ACP methyl ester carboxylesterase [Amycolatopsis rubida]